MDQKEGRPPRVRLKAPPRPRRPQDRAAYRQEDPRQPRPMQKEGRRRRTGSIPGSKAAWPCEVLRAGIGLADGVTGALTDVRDAIAWAAPEVLDGRSRGSVASDVYSLGAVLWHAAARGPPRLRHHRVSAPPGRPQPPGRCRSRSSAQAAGRSVEFRWRAARRAPGGRPARVAPVDVRGGTPHDRTVDDGAVAPPGVPAGAADPGGPAVTEPQPRPAAHGGGATRRRVLARRRGPRRG